MARYKIAIIIPVFNQWNITLNCLKSISEHTEISKVQVIVVDNGSIDDTVHHCDYIGRKLFRENFRYVRLESNINFGPGCNLGVKFTDAEYLFFLNNDTTLTCGWADPLLQAMQDDPKLGAVGPLLLYPGMNRVQHAGLAFTPELDAVHLYEFFPDFHPLIHKSRYVQAITGAAFFVPKHLFEENNGFYPGFQNGCEDIDFCLRLKKKFLKFKCITNSVVYHFTSQTEGRFAQEDRNRSLFIERCGSLVVPDYHHHIISDGYRPCLTPWMKMYFTHPISIENCRFLEKKMIEINELWAMLHKDPLFFKGYDELASHFEENKDYKRACAIRFLEVNFFPSLNSCKNLLRLAILSEQNKLIQNIMNTVNYIENRMNSRVQLIKTAKNIIKLYKNGKDDILFDLYKNWIDSYAEFDNFMNLNKILKYEKM